MQGDKPRCAIYCRVANEDEEIPGAAMERQKQQLLEYAREMGYTETAAYVDNGYSGHDPERPGFTKLNADIEAGLVNVVIAKDPSRFRKNDVSGGQWYSHMDKKGVTVLCRDAPGFGQDIWETRTALEDLPKRKKRKQERHTVRTPPPQSKSR